MQVVCSLVSINVDSPQLRIQWKQTVLIQRYAQFWYFRRGSGTSFSTFWVWFLRKNVFYVIIIYYVTNFHCLIAFTSRDIVQFVYYNCLLTGCDVMHFEIKLILLIKPFCCTTKKSRQKVRYLENENNFWGEIKSIFHHF